MQRAVKVLTSLLALAVLWPSGGGRCRGAEAAAAPDPATYLYDLLEAAVPRMAEQKLDLSPFSPLKEDDTQHRFQGCPVLVNDRLAAVLHRDTPAVDLYWRQVGLRLRAQLQPPCRDGRVPAGAGPLQAQAQSLLVKENTQGCVAVEAGFRNRDGQPCRIRYELSAGAPLLKMTAGPGVARLRVSAACRFAVLPDFFADDILIDAAAMPAGRAELPSENFLLDMLPGGDSLLMTVSESRDEPIEIMACSAPPRIAYSDIPFGAKRQVWVALLTGKGIWHAHTIALADAGKQIPLAWKMPFQALWCVDGPRPTR